MRLPPDFRGVSIRIPFGLRARTMEKKVQHQKLWEYTMQFRRKDEIGISWKLLQFGGTANFSWLSTKIMCVHLSKSCFILNVGHITRH